MRPAKRGEVEAGNRVQPGDDAAREAGRGGGTSQPHSGEVEAGNRVQPGDDAAREAGRGGGTSQPHSGEVEAGNPAAAR
jgi:hypothetical protein